jgi:hypothetical protein
MSIRESGKSKFWRKMKIPPLARRQQRSWLAITMNTLLNPFNWQVGWALVLGAFVTGAGIGLFIHREDFLGGYQSYRRRMLRLGHIALAALGMLNVLFALTPWALPAAGGCFIVGGVAMPTVCFLAAWREKCRHLFFVPVLALVAGVVVLLWCSGASVKRPGVAGQLPALHRGAALTGD